MTRIWRIYTNRVFSNLFRVCWTLFNLLFTFFSCSWREWLLCKVVNPILQVSRSVSSRPHLRFSACLVCSPLTLHRRMDALIRDWTSTLLDSNAGEKCTASTASKACMLCMLCFWGHGGSQAQRCSFIGEQNIKTPGVECEPERHVYRWFCASRSSCQWSARVWLAHVHMHDWQVFGQLLMSESVLQPFERMSWIQPQCCLWTSYNLARSWIQCWTSFAILGKVCWLEPALTLQKACDDIPAQLSSDMAST